MDDLVLILKVSADELSATQGGERRLELPLAFWRGLSQGLRDAGHVQLAAVIDKAVGAAQARERLLAEKLQCMEPAYDQEVQTHCQILLAEDLRPEERA